MVEMAIILPFLVFLVFGITEIGRALYQQNTLTKSVEVGARYLSRAYGAIDDMSTCSAPNWMSHHPSAINLIETGTVDGSGELLLSNLTVVEITEPRPEVTGCVFSIKANASFVSIMGGAEGLRIPFGGELWEIGPLTLHASVEERYLGE